MRKVELRMREQEKYKAGLSRQVEKTSIFTK